MRSTSDELAKARERHMRTSVVGAGLGLVLLMLPIMLPISTIGATAALVGTAATASAVGSSVQQR